MTARHTLGPWQVFHESTYSWVGVAVHGQTGWREIAKVYEPDCVGNTRLIGEAPAMLEALQRIVKEARAIVNVRGCEGEPKGHACSACEILFVAEQAIAKATEGK